MAQQRLLLDLELGTEPISGLLRDEQGLTARSFASWLELIAVLEAFRGEAPPAGTDAGGMDPKRGSRNGEVDGRGP
jgi:hypothetical protein